ncbi:hypothetical protein BGX27_010064 [Mortierella sp. AM989]|nr:hypothetical protein BGX27_010064 [Mortierella sp. AM989]
MQSRVQGEHTKLIIRDLSSKYGVFVNKKRIESAKDIEVVIEEDQMWVNQDKRHVAGRGYGGFVTVVIGDKTSFRLERVDWSLCSQGLTALAKVGIISTAAEIDCKVDDAWIPGTSTHLVVGKSKRSEKSSLALAEGGHLVNVAWLKAVETSFKESWDSKGQKDALSLETDFPAPVPDAFKTSNIQWTPNAKRRVLFKDYCFISVAAVKYKGLSQVIQCAGGSWKRVDSTASLNLINECMIATVIPVFLYPHGEDNVAKTYSKLDTVLKKMRYRWVHEDEIGMAILYSSTDIYCNPKYLDALPTLETMASLQSSQFPSSQYLGGSEVPSSISAPSTLSRSGSTTGSNVYDPQVIDDDTELAEASLGFSQLMLPSKKSNRPLKSSNAIQAAPQTAELLGRERPAKKKTKIDHMAMFFDGLEDDDVIELDPIEPKKPLEAAKDMVPGTFPTSTPMQDANYVLNLHPNTGSKLSKLDLTNMMKIVSKEQPISPGIEVESELSALPLNGKKSNGVDSKVDNKVDSKVNPKGSAVAGDSFDNTESPSQDQSSQHSALLSGTGSKKKATPFDGVRKDMLALNLDVKVGRQKESLDEKERLQRLEAQRLQEKSKGSAEKLMQSEWSERLVVNSKRRKLTEDESAIQQSAIQQSAIQQSCLPAGSQTSTDNSSDIQILSEVDQKNWPEKWKNLPNFKIHNMTDSALHSKWKNVPNFKAFRKSTMTGVCIKPRQPVTITFNGEVKLEEGVQKSWQRIKQEPQDSPIPSPIPRRKVGEIQMAREDLKLLLADD